MSGKQRTIYFFSADEVDQNDQHTEYEAGWWSDLFDSIEGLPEEDRRLTHRQRRYEGEILQERSPHVRYLYLGKLRPGADWPDVTDRSGRRGPLADTGIDGLWEPAYIVEVPRTRYVAVLRSSGGPTFSAIEAWLSHVGNFDYNDTRLVLRPYVRSGQMEKLQSAWGASRVHLKVDSEALRGIDPGTKITRALAEATDLGTSSVSLDVILSFGNAIPDEAGAEEMAAALTDLIGHVPVTKAEATLIGSDMQKDKVDFIRDRVTLTQELGDSEDETPTPQVVLSAMSEAISRFRDQIGA
ncbi:MULTISPECIES: hypothetical protein [Curtobacterium]|uniref:hypothetical protein n=1 Tax=Curtobacterium TaxID=2034 RepID=UPI0021C90AEC|nr:hypothetical protein [Curtobacterium flaccumfaciens]MCU0115472.1 hypothetical protein [Curtobacterium flaccumfaciens]